jgi:hypothetical protein
MNEYLIELGFIWYVYNTVLGLAGFALFVWWWATVRSASFVYKCVTVLFLAWAVQNFLGGYNRFFYLSGDYDSLHNLLGTPLWQYRTFPSTVVFTTIVVAMLLRVRKTLNEAENKN